MQPPYEDYSDHLSLKVCRELCRIGYRLPVRSAERMMRALTKLVPKPRPQGPCSIRTAHGFKMLVDPNVDRGIERALFNYGTYEDGTLRMLDHLLPAGGCFIDIGSNIGLMSLYAAQRLQGRGQVLAFEAMPGTYGILLQNIALNGLSNVSAVNLAIGSADGTVEIYDNLAVNRGAASLIRPEVAGAGHRVPVRRLDDYLAEHAPGRRIDCIKIDVEGWEFEVLKGAGRTLSALEAPVCIVECSMLQPTYGGTVRDVYELLRTAHGYRVYRMARGKEKSSRLVEIASADELPRHDNLFCFQARHLQALPRRLFA